MKPGTHIKLPDGREATVVFHGLTGYGIKWGLHDPRSTDFDGTTGGCFDDDMADDWPWQPEAMLRDANLTERLGMECVGEEYEIIDPTQ